MCPRKQTSLLSVLPMMYKLHIYMYVDKELGWTSWELYNFVLIGLTNELIELGAPVDIKVTVLQLWARYLGKLEVAFTSTKKRLVPKLARKYKKRYFIYIIKYIIIYLYN